jgi:hypothetical protein
MSGHSKKEIFQLVNDALHFAKEVSETGNDAFDIDEPIHLFWTVKGNDDATSYMFEDVTKETQSFIDGDLVLVFSDYDVENPQPCYNFWSVAMKDFMNSLDALKEEEGFDIEWIEQEDYYSLWKSHSTKISLPGHIRSEDDEVYQYVNTMTRDKLMLSTKSDVPTTPKASTTPTNPPPAPQKRKYMDEMEKREQREKRQRH